MIEFIASLPWDNINILEVLGFSVGLLYLWWEYHADSRLWYASIVMPTISMWLYFSKGIYADFAINIYYFFIAIYGWWMWTRAQRRGEDSSAKKEKKELPIVSIPLKILLACVGAFLVLWGALYCVLEFATDSNVPLVDAFTTALSIVAMWMLAQKYLEQWLAWLAVDAVCVGLYAYKGIYFYAVLYAIYTVIAFKGYLNWRKMMHSNQQS